MPTMSKQDLFDAEREAVYLGPSSRVNFEPHGKVIADLLVEIEKKARIHGMADVLMELDRMSVVNTSDWYEIAGDRLIAISTLVASNLKALEK